jgi:hypothetical protein
MAVVEIDVKKWAEEQFGTCQLGDVRRTRRLVQFAAQVAADPDGTTPLQVEEWSDLKAAYRLIEEEDVTFTGIAEPHWQLTRQRSGGTWLIIDDTTEVNFGATNRARGLGPLGRGQGRGFLLHSGLMVNPATKEVIGLAGQIVRYRRPAPKGESRSRRLKRNRESLMWGQLIEQIGRPPDRTQFVHVCDRGADNFEVYCRLRLTDNDWVVRAARLERVVLHEGREIPLARYLKQLPLAGTYELSLGATKKHGPRVAKLEVRYGTVTVPRPRQVSPWVRGCGISEITMQVVEVREVDAPRGVERLHWVLLTSLPVMVFEQAWTVIEYYEQRPVVEDFHKALKTGCRVEERQYETSGRLEAITALLSVTAVRLLQLRSVARATPDRPAAEVVPLHWITVLERLRRGRTIRTVREFYRQLAGLGGHLLRKRDGEPGWITLWRGFEKLHLAVRAVDSYRKKCG